MKAFSIKQPYANKILTGLKTIELRSWQTTYRGDLLICTSRAPALFLKKLQEVDRDGRNKVVDKEYGDEDYMYFGKALFVVELYDVAPMKKKDEVDADAIFSKDLFSWHLRNVRPIKPFDVKGKLGFFDVDEPVVFLKRETA